MEDIFEKIEPEPTIDEPVDAPVSDGLQAGTQDRDDAIAEVKRLEALLESAFKAEAESAKKIKALEDERDALRAKNSELANALGQSKSDIGNLIQIFGRRDSDLSSDIGTLSRLLRPQPQQRPRS